MPRSGQTRALVNGLLGALTLPGHVDAAPPTVADGADCAFTMDTAGNARVVVLNTAGQAVFVVNQNGIADTLLAAGSVVAPGAGAAIVTLAVTAGVYDVEVLAGYGAVADAVDNMQFRNNATVVGSLIVNTGVNSPANTTRLKRVTAAGGVNFTVNAIAAGGAGSVFIAQISATRIA